MSNTSPPEAEEEARLLAAWVGGDGAAAQALVRRYYRPIYLFFYGRVGPDATEDLTQATFETLCAKKVTFRGDSTVRTYLYAIARWKLVHHFRALRGGVQFEPMEESFEVAEVVRSMTSLFAGRQKEQLVVQALRALPLDDQIILELKHYEGMTARELAAMYDVSFQTMRGRLARARSKLEDAVRELAKSAAMVASAIEGLDTCMKQIRERLHNAADTAK